MKGKTTNFALLFVLGCATIISVGCGGGGGGGSTPNPNQGFYVTVTANGIPTVARVQGNLVGGNPTAGSLDEFNIDTFGAGFTQIPNAKVPGTWRMTYGPAIATPSLCLGFVTTDRNVSLGSMETLPCTPRFFSFTASPNTIDASNPPAVITFTGGGIENLQGTPVIAYYNEFGNVVASSSNNQMSYDGFGAVESLLASVPDLTYVYNGIYTVAVHNVNPDGTWEIIGAAQITIYGNPPPPPPPPPPPGECGTSNPGQPELPCQTY